MKLVGLVALLLLAGCSGPVSDDNQVETPSVEANPEIAGNHTSTSNGTVPLPSNNTEVTVWTGTSLSFSYNDTKDFAAQYQIQYLPQSGCTLNWDFDGDDGIFAGYHSDSWSTVLANRVVLVNNDGAVTNPSNGPNTGGGSAGRPNSAGNETALLYVDGDGAWTMTWFIECDKIVTIELLRSSNETTLLRGDNHQGKSVEVTTTGAIYNEAAWSFQTRAPAELMVFGPGATEAEWTFSGPTALTTSMATEFEMFNLAPGQYESVLNGLFTGNRSPWAAIINWE